MAGQEGRRGEGVLLVVSGPSGSGKSTMCRAAVAQTDAELSVSATTRPRSERETEGKDYYFLDEREFLAKVAAGEFLEHARVFDHYYGTPAEAVRQKLAQGCTVILEIDVQGAMQVFEKFPEAVGILVLPPSSTELQRRLSDRGREDRKTLAKRLAKGNWEIEQAKACGRYKHTIINDKLDRAIEQLKTIIQSKAEKPIEKTAKVDPRK